MNSPSVNSQLKNLPHHLKETQERLTPEKSALMLRVALAIGFGIFLMTQSHLAGQITFITLSILCVYSSFQPLYPWLKRTYQDKTLRVKAVYICIDVVLICYLYAALPEHRSITLLYLSAITASNCANASRTDYNFSAILTTALMIPTSILSFISAGTPPDAHWWLAGLITGSIFYSLHFHCKLVDELNEIRTTGSDIDPISGMLQKPAFIKASRVLLDMNTNNHISSVMMMINIERTDFDKIITDQDKTKSYLEAVKQLSRIIYVNIKPEDIVCRYAANRFVMIMCDLDKEDGETIAYRLQHEFTLWTERKHRDLCLVVAMTAIPSFTVPLEVLIHHTEKSIMKAQKQTGIPGLIISEDITSKDLVN